MCMILLLWGSVCPVHRDRGRRVGARPGEGASVGNGSRVSTGEEDLGTDGGEGCTTA